MSALSSPYHASAPRLSVRAVLLIAAAHAGVLVLLASLDVVPIPTAVRTLTVDLIRPAAPPPAPPQEVVKPKPRPVEAQPRPRRQPEPLPQPMLAAPAESPAPAAEVPVAPIMREAPPAPPAPVTVSQPRFDADYLTNPAPAYPPLSRRMGEEGKVVLRVHVEPNGLPSQVEVKTSSGSPRLDQAAQDAVRRWRFVPAKRGDEAVAAWVLVPIAFNLKN